jgi:hypothetical protein
MNINERPFFISKDVLDTINSASWFLMDAMWMLQMERISVAMIIPTIATGVLLVYIEKRKTLTLINLAILSWICMNVSWMFSEVLEIPFYLTVAKSLFGLGLSFILAAVFVSGSVTETFSHFKRFRILEKLRKAP